MWNRTQPPRAFNVYASWCGLNAYVGQVAYRDETLSEATALQKRGARIKVTRSLLGGTVPLDSLERMIPPKR